MYKVMPRSVEKSSRGPGRELSINDQIQGADALAGRGSDPCVEQLELWTVFGPWRRLLQVAAIASLFMGGVAPLGGQRRESGHAT